MVKFAKIILVFITLLPFSGYTSQVEREEILLRPSRPYVEHIFLEQESITAYFEVTNIDVYKKLIPSIFSMPEKPLHRVAVIDFYKMGSAPSYLELIGAVSCKQALHGAARPSAAWVND
jgi:hypothetical protein